MSSNLPTYRPMLCFENNLYSDIELVAGNTIKDMQYVGMIEDIIPPTRKPNKNFQSNEDGYLYAKVYRDSVGNILILLTNGNVLKMEKLNIIS